MYYLVRRQYAPQKATAPRKAPPLGTKTTANMNKVD